MTDRGRKKRDTPHDLESTEMIGFGVHSWINLVVKQRVIHDTKNPKSCLGFLWKNTIGNTLDRGRRDNERKQNWTHEGKRRPSTQNENICPALSKWLLQPCGEKERKMGRERDKALVSGFCRLMLPQMSTYGPLGHMAAIRRYFLLMKHNMEEKELTLLLSSRLSHSQSNVVNERRSDKIALSLSFSRQPSIFLLSFLCFTLSILDVSDNDDFPSTFFCHCQRSV